MIQWSSCAAATCVLPEEVLSRCRILQRHGAQSTRRLLLVFKSILIVHALDVSIALKLVRILLFLHHGIIVSPCILDGLLLFPVGAEASHLLHHFSLTLFAARRGFSARLLEGDSVELVHVF